MTFALYVSLTAAVTSRRVTYSVGYLIVPRLWRIGRIHYGEDAFYQNVQVQKLYNLIIMIIMRL